MDRLYTKFVDCCIKCTHSNVIKHRIMVNVQGGSNKTGTNCDLFTHKSSRSYLNHLVITFSRQYLFIFAPVHILISCHTQFVMLSSISTSNVTKSHSHQRQTERWMQSSINTPWKHNTCCSTESLSSLLGVPCFHSLSPILSKPPTTWY
jgi:hypothetical protein